MKCASDYLAAADADYRSKVLGQHKMFLPLQ